MLCILQDEDVFTFLDPEPQSQRDHSYKKLEHNRDRMRGKSMDCTSNGRPGKLTRWSLMKTKRFPSSLPEPEAAEELDAMLGVSTETYFSCAVARKRSTARYTLPSSDEVVTFFKALADALWASQGSCYSSTQMYYKYIQLGMPILRSCIWSKCLLQILFCWSNSLYLQAQSSCSHILKSCIWLEYLLQLLLFFCWSNCYDLQV